MNKKDIVSPTEISIVCFCTMIEIYFCFCQDGVMLCSQTHSTKHEDNVCQNLGPPEII